MNSPLVFVVILNWNGKSCLDRSLKSVFRMKYDNFQVVVVDNDSRDGSFEEARRNFGKAHFIRNEENVGFARGMNVGMRFAIAHGAEYLWILNNDTEVEVGTLTELVLTAKSSGTRNLYSPLIVFPDGKEWFSGGEIMWWRMRAVHTLIRHRDDVPYVTGFLTGCALFLSKASAVRLNLFDERYFLYYEDADLSVRAKALGMDCIMVPKARIIHSESSRSNPDKLYWLVRSGLQFFDHRSPALLRPWIFCFTLLRRLKNRIDVMNHRDNAVTIRKAFRAYAKKTAV